jgi:hypothetical protein
LEIDVNPLDFLLGKTKPASRGSVPGFPPPPKGRFPASFGAPRVPITSAATGTSSLLGPVATLADIYHQGSKVFNPKDNIITSIQNLSTSIGNQFAKPGQEGRYVGSNPIAVRANRELDSRNRSYYGPAYASAEALGLGGSAPSLRNYGPGYKEDELAAGAAAERFRPGAGFPGQQGAADRAYQEELSRTAQLTAQDPELQRYEKARSAAKTQEEMNAVRDMGMEIWAKKYGGEKGLASRVKPGQVGYDVIQKTLYPQGSPLPPLPEDSLAMLNAIAPANAQGIRENVTPTLGQMPVFGDASEAMYQAVTNGGTLVTPMLSPQSKTTQQETAQLLADTYKSSFLGDDEFAKRLRAMDPYMQ